MKIKIHRYVLFGLLFVVAKIFRFIPLSVCSLIGAWMGRLLYWILPHERKKTLKNLNRVFRQEKSQAEIRCIAKNTFANLGRNFCEWLKMPFLTSQQILDQVEIENDERIQEVLEKKKGLILLTGHFGNWEWLAAYFCSLGHQGVVLARRIYFEPYNRMLVGLRAAHSVNTFYREDSPKEILKILARNQILGILPDQDVDKINGIFIPFFGKEAYTPTAPVALALASGAPLVPVFLTRQKGKFKIVVEKPIEVKKLSDKKESLRRYTIEWSVVLERWIKQYPDHWVWMHRRWKTKKNDMQE